MSKWICCVLFALATTAFGADFSGTWKAKYTTPDGVERESTFQFQQDGSKLTGSMDSKPGGKQVIDKGQVNADAIDFHLISEHDGAAYRIHIKGKLEGEDLKLRLECNDGEGGFDFVAHRAS